MTTELVPSPFCGSPAYTHRNGETATGYGISTSTPPAEVQEKRVLLDFYNEVCDQAERNMAATNTVSGAHWNAMRQVLARKGVEVAR